MDFLIARLKEKGTQSTLVGVIVWVAAMLGLDLTVEQQLNVTILVGGVVGLFVSFFKEKTDETGK